MASLMSDIKNPFLKDYSTTSLLKKNFGVLLIQSQVKENQQSFNYEYKKQPQTTIKQNISTSSSIFNPFSQKSLNAFELLHQKKDPHNFKNSEVRSLSQNRNFLGSLQKNVFYKGLEDLGTKQMMKNETERQARYQLKHFGAQTLRYQYVPMENYSSSYSQQKLNPYTSQERISTKRIDSSHNIQTPKWNVNITSEYYGYDGVKEKKEEEDFVIQKSKKTSFRNSSKDPLEKSKKQRHSYYQNISHIPQDRNQDFETARHINLKPNTNELDFLRNSSSSQKRVSIENYPQNFHPQSSESSGFGCSSQMYESGANFMTKLGKKKGGPLDTHAFDDDEKEEAEDFDLDQFEDIQKKQSNQKRQNRTKYPDALEHNNRIYYKINL